MAPAPLRRPIAPRRISGPVRHPRAAPLAPAQRGHAFARILDAPFLDRLIRGRAWIALVAFALLGIVAMQVTILRLGASIGRSVTEIEQLTQQNETTATEIAALEPGRNVAAKAAALGMVYPPDDTIQYLRFSAGDSAAAAAAISAPAFAPLKANPGLTSPLTGAGASEQGSSSTTVGASTTANTSTTTASTDTTGTPSTTQTAETTAPVTSTATTSTTPSNATTGTVVQTTAGGGVVPGAGSQTATSQGGASAPGSGAAG